MKNLFLRSVTGILYVALVVGVIMYGNAKGFLILCAVFAALSVYELDTISHKRTLMTDCVVLFDVIGSALIITAVYFAYYGDTDHMVDLALCFLMYILGRLTLQLFSHKYLSMQSLATSMMAQLYISIPLSVALLLYMMFGPWMMLSVFVLIWLNDTGAFVVGSSIGRHRLYESVSPKKSWEGFFGGMIFCIIAAVLFQYYYMGPAMGYTVVASISLGVIVPVVATWGDLAESMIKRSLNVKDSGHILPGHGGILDRIDSLLLVVPAVVLWLVMTMFGLM